MSTPDEDVKLNQSPYSPEDIELGSKFANRWTRRLLGWGVEARGILPVPVEQRTNKRIHEIFFIWFTWNFNILSFSSGTLGPAFGLGLRDSCLVILFFNLLCSAPPAWFATWGPKLGLRQMTQARYSFGYYGAIVPSILNIIGMMGFCILNCILGGQTLAAVSDGSLSWTVGIVVIAAISIVVAFCGIRVVTWYERLAWLPVLVSFAVALGVGGTHMSAGAAAPPAGAPAVLSFASVIAGFVITYSPLGSDYTTYLDPAAPAWRVFAFAYAGLVLPIVLLQCLGAAAALAAAEYAPWGAAFGDGDVGGLLAAMLAPAHGFGKFLTALLALSVVANVAPTMYSFGFSCQVIVPWTARVPRFLFALLAAAIVLPLAIVGQHRFYTALNNFLALIGYWASAFVAVVGAEHVLFRRSARGYDLRAWDAPRALPPGAAALGAALGGCALVVPAMAQVWWTGPLGARAGDLGFELAFAGAAVLYPPLRWAERRLCGR